MKTHSILRDRREGQRFTMARGAKDPGGGGEEMAAGLQSSSAYPRFLLYPHCVQS